MRPTSIQSFKKKIEHQDPNLTKIQGFRSRLNALTIVVSHESRIARYNYYYVLQPVKSKPPKIILNSDEHTFKPIEPKKTCNIFCPCLSCFVCI